MPGAEKLLMEAVFTIPMAGPCLAGTVTEEVAVTLVPDGEVPVAVPVLVIEPASTSAWVVV